VFLLNREHTSFVTRARRTFDGSAGVLNPGSALAETKLLMDFHIRHHEPAVYGYSNGFVRNDRETMGFLGPYC
jgi:hypothetical protein